MQTFPHFLKIYYFISFIAFGIYVPYFPQWLQNNGMDGFTLGFITSLVPLMGLIAPFFFGFVADSTGLRGSLLQISTFGAFFGFASLAFLGINQKIHLLGLIICISIFAFFRSPMVFMADLIAIEVSENDSSGYGKLRLWGSVGFLLSTILTGKWLKLTNHLDLPLAVSSALLVAFITSFSIRSNKVAPPKPSWSSMVDFASNTKNKFFLSAIFFGQMAHSSYDIYYTIHLRKKGFSNYSIGWFWSIGVVFEIILMAISHKIFSRYNTKFLFIYSFFIAAIRWLLISWAISPIFFAFLQFLHVFSFGLMWMPAMNYIKVHSKPERLGSAQAILFSTFALGSISGMMLWSSVHLRTGTSFIFCGASLTSMIAFFQARRMIR